jgi:hypothetical protein
MLQQNIPFLKLGEPLLKPAEFVFREIEGSAQLLSLPPRICVHKTSADVSQSRRATEVHVRRDLLYAMRNGSRSQRPSNRQIQMTLGSCKTMYTKAK